MVKRYYKLIRAKIFAIVLSVLMILCLVAYFSTIQLKALNEELVDLAEYSIPITSSISEFNVEVLQQERHFLRIVRHYQEKKPPLEPIQEEVDEFEEHGALAAKALQRAIKLSGTTATQSSRTQQKEEFQHITPLLKTIADEYSQFVKDARLNLKQFEETQGKSLQQSQMTLSSNTLLLNKNTYAILSDLENFTIQSARTTEEHEESLVKTYTWMTISALLIGFILAAITSIRLTRSMRELSNSVGQVSQQNYNLRIKENGNDEIAKLSNSFNLMLDELRVKSQIESEFSQHIDPRIVENIINDPQESRTGGKKEEITVFFSDIGCDSLYTHAMQADELIERKNVYYDVMTKSIHHHHGVIDKFIDSVVMAFWGKPFVTEDKHAQLACIAALEQAKHFHHLPYNQTLNIGIATGEAVMGNMGSEASKSFTVMGDVVNLASRLKGVAKQYGVTILISENTKQQLHQNIETREIDMIQVVGKEEAVRVYELLGVRVDLNTEQLEFRDIFEKALLEYRSRNWDTAEAYFDQCLTMYNQDKPCHLFKQRIEVFRDSPPEDAWDGTWALTKK